MTPASTYARFAPYVRRQLAALGVRDADLPDLCQEVFLVAHGKEDVLPAIDRVDLWLREICRRVAAGYRRRAGHRLEVLGCDIAERPDPGTEAGEEPDAGATLSLLRGALNHLDDESRDLLALHDAGEMPLSELARLVAHDRKTVRSRLARARRRVSHWLSGDGALDTGRRLGAAPRATPAASPFMRDQAARGRVTGCGGGELQILRVSPELCSGAIGNVTHIRVFGGHDGLHKFVDDWEYKMPESGGGAMMDIGIHMTDLARYFLGEITTVYGCMSESVWHVDGSEDNAIAIFKNPEGIVASYQTTWSEWKGYKSHVEIYGDNGMVRAAYAPMENLLIANTTRGELRKVRKLYPDIILREKLKGWKTTALLSFQEELDDFLKMVAGDYRVALADGHAGLRSVEVSDAVRTSSRSGQPVELSNIGNMYASL